MKINIGIIGAGSFSIAIAKHLSKKNFNIKMWGYRKRRSRIFKK